MIREYDVVRATRDLSDHVRKGATGTVVMVYIPEQAYEVEFMEDIYTSELLIVQADDIELVQMQ